MAHPNSSRSLCSVLSSIQLFSILILSLVAAAQSDPAAGIQPFSTQVGGQYDSIDLASSNINLIIPILNKNGKFPFKYQLVGNFGAYPISNPSFDTFYYGISRSLLGTPIAADLGAGAFGGVAGSPPPIPQDLGTYLTSTVTYSQCVNAADQQGSQIAFTNFSVVDATGAAHGVTNFSVYVVTYSGQGTTGEPFCTGPIVDGPGQTYDGSGYALTGTLTENGTNFTMTLYDRSGNVQIAPGVVQDPDGVQASMSTNSATHVTTYTDTLGQTVFVSSPGSVVSENGTPDNYTYYTYNANNNPPTVPETVTVSYSRLYQKTNFGCGSGTDFNVPGYYYFPTKIALADGETYGLSYEQTPGYPADVTGRLAKITLPDGGSIAYGYSGGSNNTGILCGYGIVPTLTRTISDANGHVGKWTYSNSVGSDGGIIYNTVTQTDPIGDVTTYTFFEGYQTEKIVTDVNLGTLSTTITCYNGYNSTQSGCITPAASNQMAYIFQTDVYTTLGTSTSPSLVETQYDHNDGCRGYGTCGDILAVRNWGVGATYPPSGTPVSETDTSYANVNGATCGPVLSYIVDHPCTVTNFSSGAMVSQTSYTYNASGHATQTTQVVNGSTNLTFTATYNSNGTIASFTDVNNTSQNPATTNFYYNGTGGCSDLLLTSTVLPVNNLTTKQTWNCTGAVLTSSTDANSQLTQYGYIDQSGNPDPLWRQRSLTDPLENTTWTNYSPGGTLPATVETVLTFNGGVSAVDQLTTLDGLSRPYLSQTRQAPGSTSFDTVVTTYDTMGRVSTVGVPCESATSASCSSPFTTTTYDALNRPLSVTDGGGGTTGYTYTNSDVLVAVGPAPSGENTKRRQFEYDGLGRLTSVCELTSTANGGGSCAQSTTQTGYWTKYTYDGLNRLLSVSQNAQSTSPQARTFSYDGLNRLTSETNPESGTTTYTYDTDSVCGTYDGDLVKRVDAMGNVTCHAYDALHRQTSVTYPSGPYAATTASKTFVYDTTTFTCPSPGANVAGQLAEAFTGPSTAKITDEAFCYSPRGETTEVYESTPHSGGYYSIPMTYWANGLIRTFGPFLGDPQLTYTPDGEGRIGVISDGGYSVPSITYYTSTGQPTGNKPAQIETSCAGSTCYPINYQYDPNTLRMTQYSAALNGGTISGTLNWNANGSLQQLVITDPFSSADVQTCAYGADDLSRLASVNCMNGSTNVWNQNFTYDAFGNITKQVPTNGTGISWIPGYNASTNRYALGGTSYDADGNVTNDTFNTYTWDAEGKTLSTAYSSGPTFTFVYDAFGHKVEWLNNGTYEASNITIGSYKLSATGQSAAYSEYPYPGGSLTSEGGGLTAAQMADWLGTTRAIYSYTGGNWIRSIAHAPFGETYVGNAQNFTGQWSDADTTNTTYYFPERQYRSSQGRWLSPDPAGMAAVESSNPQTWNRYAYALNSPLSIVDSTGLQACWPALPGENSQADSDPPCPVILDGFELPTEFSPMVQRALNNGAAVYCGSLCGPIAVQGAGFIIPRFTTEGIDYSATFNGNLDAIEEILGLPSGGNGGPSLSQCTTNILSAVNSRFGSNDTSANIIGQFYHSIGAPQGQGTLNLNISSNQPGSAAKGYYPIHWWTYVIGYGPTLHVPAGPGGNGGLDSSQTLPFKPNLFTAHIDSGYVYNPIGALFHLLFNFTPLAGYPGC
jgi:RHS repeat-associated protein